MVNTTGHTETCLPRSATTQITKSSQLLLRLINFFLSTRQFCYVFLAFYSIITNRVYTNYSLFTRTKSSTGRKLRHRTTMESMQCGKISKIISSQRATKTRKPCYRKDDRAMRPIYGYMP